MNKGLLVSLSLTLFLCNSINLQRAAAASAIPRGQSANSQILIKLRGDPNGPQTSKLESLRDSVRARSIEKLDQALAPGCYVVDLDQGISVEEAVARAAIDPRVEYAEPNYYCFPADTIPDDPLFEFMWGLENQSPDFLGRAGADIRAVPAWDFTTGDRDSVVAVLDTGIDLTHPDLAANAWINQQEIPGNAIDDDANGYVDDINGWNFLSETNRTYDDAATDYHGTHVAGTIGAVGNNGIGVTGVAWQVKIMALKFLDGRENRGLVSNAIRAVNYVIEQKRRGVKVVAMNASWVAPGKSKILLEAIATAGRAGIPLICAAGNDAKDLDEEPVYPAAENRELDSVISVAALDRFDQIAPFSNYGHETVTLGAPGTSVLGLAPDGGYAELTGTSMAAPHVAGIVVLLIAHNPELTPAELKRLLISTADPVPTLGSYTNSAGRANAHNALSASVPRLPDPSIGEVEATKRVLTVNGVGFLSGSSVIEIDGSTLAEIRYKSSYIVSNDTITKLAVKLGKKGMDRKLPLGVPVIVTVYNPSTGARSEPFVFTRSKQGGPE